MEPLRIFIGYDRRFPEPARVLEYSIIKNATCPVHIQFLHLGYLQEVYHFDRVPDPLASTEFTYSRFLVPFLCNYRGRAVFMDNDMVVQGDVRELAELTMDGLALRVVKHNQEAVDGAKKMYGATQTSYPRKNWSSVMVMNCDRLKLWTQRIVEQASGAYLHRFKDIPDDQIGLLDWKWNYLVNPDKPHPDIASIKLIHWTEGSPCFDAYRNCAHADIYHGLVQEMKDKPHWRSELT